VPLEAMKRRRRIELGESFKLAADADSKPGVGGGRDADLWGILTVGLWYWITGVPEDADSSRRTRRLRRSGTRRASPPRDP
jgi:hypothetical protein